MRQINFSGSKKILISIIILHLMAFSLFLGFDLALFSPVLGVSLIFAIKKWVSLTSKNSIKSLRIQAKGWQILVNDEWLKADCTEARFFGWVFLIFKDKKQHFAGLVAPDSLNKNDWQDLIIAIKTRQ